MTPAELSIIIRSLLSLIVLAFVIFSLWPAQRVDIFRQQMFSIRDELFDFAAEGKISFGDPAYILLRQLMNGFIRYAHNLTPYRTLCSFLRWKYMPHELAIIEWAARWNKALSEIKDPEVRTQLEEFHSRASMLVLSQLILSPGLLVTLVPPFIVFAILYHQWASLKSIYSDIQDRVPMAFLEEEAANS